MTEPLDPPDPPEECVCEYCGSPEQQRIGRMMFECGRFPGRGRSDDCYEREIEQLKEQKKELQKLIHDGNVAFGYQTARLQDVTSVAKGDEAALAKLKEDHSKMLKGPVVTGLVEALKEHSNSMARFKAIAAYDEAVKGEK